jgi:hypothetical protein
MTVCQAPTKIMLVLCLCLSFVGCSSGNSGSEPLPPPPVLSCNGTGPRSGASFPIVGEVEPNNDISTAFGVTIPTPTADKSVGLLVIGSVHDSLDPIDTISFTSSRTIKFFIKLCEDSCNIAAGSDRDGNPDSLDTSIAYFDVLDAAGVIMASTGANNPTENYKELCIEGGVITYLMVNANDTLNAAQNYKISAMETPF